MSCSLEEYDEYFDLRQLLIRNYSSYIKSFIEVGNTRIQRYVEQELFEYGMLWPEPLIQLNPLFQPGTSLDALVADDILHPACARIFWRNKEPLKPQGDPAIAPTSGRSDSGGAWRP